MQQFSPARAIDGHTPGCFFNRVTQALSGYVLDVLREMPVAKDADGEPVVPALHEARAYLGSASIECDVDLRPIGLSSATPLRATYSPGQGRLDWFMHCAYIASTPGTWTPEDTASALTPEKLRHAHDVFLGKAPHVMPPSERGR